MEQTRAFSRSGRPVAQMTNSVHQVHARSHDHLASAIAPPLSLSLSLYCSLLSNLLQFLSTRRYWVCIRLSLIIREYSDVVRDTRIISRRAKPEIRPFSGELSFLWQQILQTSLSSETFSTLHNKTIVIQWINWLTVAKDRARKKTQWQRPFCRDNEIPFLTDVRWIEAAKVLMPSHYLDRIRTRYDKRAGRFIYVGNCATGNPRRKQPLARDGSAINAARSSRGTGNGASIRRRRVGEIYRRDLFFISSSLPFSSLIRALSGSPLASRKASGGNATRRHTRVEYNSTRARDSSPLVAQSLRTISFLSITETRLYLAYVNLMKHDDWAN